MRESWMLTLSIICFMIARIALSFPSSSLAPNTENAAEKAPTGSASLTSKVETTPPKIEATKTQVLNNSDPTKPAVKTSSSSQVLGKGEDSNTSNSQTASSVPSKLDSHEAPTAEQPSGNQNNNSGDQSPPTGDQSPPTGDQSPAAGDQSPAAGDQTPAADGQSPAAAGKSSVVGAKSTLVPASVATGKQSTNQAQGDGDVANPIDTKADAPADDTLKENDNVDKTSQGGNDTQENGEISEGDKPENAAIGDNINEAEAVEDDTKAANESNGNTSVDSKSPTEEKQEEGDTIPKETSDETGSQKQMAEEGSDVSSSQVGGVSKAPEIPAEGQKGSTAPKQEKETTPPPKKEENGDISPVIEGGSQAKAPMDQIEDDYGSYPDADKSGSFADGSTAQIGPSYNYGSMGEVPGRGAEDDDESYIELGRNDIADKPSSGDQKMGGHFTDDEDSHFFAYFLTIMVTAIIFYLVFHNKQRIIALIIEGRVTRNGRGSRRSSSRAKYHKLDNNLEEAITATKGSNGF